MKTIIFITIITVLLSFRFAANAQNWLIAGNSNITTTKFLGTTNNQPLIVKTNNAERMRVLGNGNVAIGTATPESKLHVFKGSAGSVTGYVNAPLIVENSTHSFINILAPENAETGILFGKPSGNTSGGIIYNESSDLNGFQFRTNGNVTRMVLNDKGNLGVGTLDPEARIQVESVGNAAAIYAVARSNGGRGVLGQALGNGGTGVAGSAEGVSGIGVAGFAPDGVAVNGSSFGSGIGVYAFSSGNYGGFHCFFLRKVSVISFQKSAVTVTIQTITIPAMKDNLIHFALQT